MTDRQDSEQATSRQVTSGQVADSLATSRTVSTVFDRLLAAVNDGTLLPGQRISDAQLAEQFGVSRTPVREALQRLREIGVVEASASRFTRVAEVTPQQTAQSYTVWLALYRAVVEEVIPTVTAETTDLLAADHAAYLASLASADPQTIATANYFFFSRLPQLSVNPALQRAITSVVHVVRLGSLHLPEYIDLGAVATAQQMLIEAAVARDVELAHQAMLVLGSIEVPQD